MDLPDGANERLGMQRAASEALERGDGEGHEARQLN